MVTTSTSVLCLFVYECASLVRVSILLFLSYIYIDFDENTLIDEHGSSENTDRLNDKSLNYWVIIKQDRLGTHSLHAFLVK